MRHTSKRAAEMVVVAHPYISRYELLFANMTAIGLLDPHPLLLGPRRHVFWIEHSAVEIGCHLIQPVHQPFRGRVAAIETQSITLIPALRFVEVALDVDTYAERNMSVTNVVVDGLEQAFEIYIDHVRSNVLISVVGELENVVVLVGQLDPALVQQGAISLVLLELGR